MDALRLIIADTRTATRAVWQTAFRNIPSAEVVDLGLSDLLALPDLDALLVSVVFAHEFYNAPLEAGKCLIIDTRAVPHHPPHLPKLPSWLVTTVYYRLARNWARDATTVPAASLRDGGQWLDDTLPTFGTIFRTLAEFNQQMDSGHISTLGIDLRSLNFPRHDAITEATSMASAYQQQNSTA